MQPPVALRLIARNRCDEAIAASPKWPNALQCNARCASASPRWAAVTNARSARRGNAVHVALVAHGVDRDSAIALRIRYYHRTYRQYHYALLRGRFSARTVNDDANEREPNSQPTTVTTRRKSSFPKILNSSVPAYRRRACGLHPAPRAKSRSFGFIPDAYCPTSRSGSARFACVGVCDRLSVQPLS